MHTITYIQSFNKCLIRICQTLPVETLKTQESIKSKIKIFSNILYSQF